MKIDGWVNIERCTKLGDRLDGYIVQDHVDPTAWVKDIEKKKGSFGYLYFDKKPLITSYITV
ncbi:MAG: hypothetical protein ABI045_06700 [Flavobacteriales bacterium]